MIKRYMNNLIIKIFSRRMIKKNKKLIKNYGIGLKDIDSIDQDLWTDFRKADK